MKKEIILKTVKNIPATLKARTEFPLLVDAIKNALGVPEAAVEIYYDDIHAVTIENTSDSIIVKYSFGASETFKVNNKPNLYRRAAFLIASDSITDSILEYLEKVKSFNVIIKAEIDNRPYRVNNRSAIPSPFRRLAK